MCPAPLNSCGQDVPQRVEQLHKQLLIQTAALDSTLHAIAITDISGHILWINSTFSKMSGYPVSEVIGQTFRLLKSGWQEQAFYMNLWETILAGKVWHGELTNRRKDGKLFSEELTITPIRGEAGDITNFVAVMHDISINKQREVEIDAVLTVANDLRTASDRAGIVPILLKQAMRLLDANGSAIAFLDTASKDMLIELGLGELRKWTGLRIPAGEGVTSQVFKTGLPVTISGASAYNQSIAKEPIPRTSYAACVPLVAQEHTVGALWISSESRIEEKSLTLLNAVTDIAANAVYRANLQVKTDQRLKRLAALRVIDEAISSSLDLSMTLGILLDQLLWQLDVDAADVLLLNPNKGTLEYAALRGFHSRDVSYGRFKVGEGIAGKVVETREVIQVPDLNQVEDQDSRIEQVKGEGFISYLAVPLIAKGEVKGVLDIYHRKKVLPDREWMNFLEALAKQAAIAIDNALLFENLQRSNLEVMNTYDITLEGWVRTLGLRDGDTGGHTQRVTDYTLKLAKAVGVADTEMENIRRGALLHDIGKMGIPDNVLRKSGPLTDEERSIIHMHPIYAYELLMPIPYLRTAIDIPYCHHEKWDGSGYPRGLKGEEIPLAARLFSVADVWDALRSDRPYRSSWSEEKAVLYLRKQSGCHFDPRVVEIFFQSGIL
ncbi:MAG: GAF domain-containing protein [Chloroflexi bacterium]|nr:MAG: GAF domain-containing protein [Chloroflexota bacterium]